MDTQKMNYEEKILKTLKDFGRMPTSRISAICGINPQTTLKELEKLLDENKVIKETETLATYWRLSK